MKASVKGNERAALKAVKRQWCVRVVTAVLKAGKGSGKGRGKAVLKAGGKAV